MARLFRDCPEAVEESLRFLDRIHFTLDELRYEYPHEPVPDGWTAQGWLEHLVMKASADDAIPTACRPNGGRCWTRSSA